MHIISDGAINISDPAAVALAAVKVKLVFANLRVHKRLDHFTVRSKAKVDVQWKFFALVHNICKIHHYGIVQ